MHTKIRKWKKEAILIRFRWGYSRFEPGVNSREDVFFFLLFVFWFFNCSCFVCLFFFFELESEKHRLTEREYSNFTLINCFVLFIATGSAKITSSKTECVFLGAWCTRTIWISAERESFVRQDLPHLERYTLLLSFQVFIDPCKLMHTVETVNRVHCSRQLSPSCLQQRMLQSG